MTPLEQAIDSASVDWRMRLSMRLGALLEGGSLTGPWPSGDHGLSHGPFQIYSAVHDVTHAQANDPQFAVNFMKAAYAAGVARVEREQPGLFDRDPASAAALAAYYAEKPAEMYPADRVRGKFAQLAGWLASIGKTVGDLVPIDFPGLPSIPNPLGDVGGQLGAIWSQLSDPAFWRRAAAVAIGLALVLAGAQLVLFSAREPVVELVDKVM